MDHVRVRGGGSGRYHSRAVMPPPRPPRPPAPAPPRPPAASGAPPAASGAAAASGPPPGPPGPNPPPMVRRMVLAPPLPMISYIRSMPLWFDDMNPRYPGD